MLTIEDDDCSKLSWTSNLKWSSGPLQHSELTCGQRKPADCILEVTLKNWFNFVAGNAFGYKALQKKIWKIFWSTFVTYPVVEKQAGDWGNRRTRYAISWENMFFQHLTDKQNLQAVSKKKAVFIWVGCVPKWMYLTIAWVRMKNGWLNLKSSSCTLRRFVLIILPTITSRLRSMFVPGTPCWWAQM